MAYCSKCGNDIGNAAFCSRCGAGRYSERRGVSSAVRPQAVPVPPVAHYPASQSAIGDAWRFARPSYTPRAMRGKTCPNCGHGWGNARTCRFCRQLEGAPTGMVLASPAQRLFALMLDALLIVVTLAAGWLLWALFTFPQGQTPAKSLIGIRVARLRSGHAAGVGWMTIREIIAKPILGLAVITSLWLFIDADTQELWDKIAGTVVVDDPQGLTVAA